MKRLLLWLANRRRADIIDDQSLTWTWGRLSLMVLTHSDEWNDNRPLDRTSWWLSLSGNYVASKGWRGTETTYVKAPALRLWRSTQPMNITLAEPRTFEDSLLSLGWMNYEEIRFDTDRQVWLLVWS